MRGGVASSRMEADIAVLERLLFVAVCRTAGRVSRLIVAPFGWGYLRTRADEADVRTQSRWMKPTNETPGSTVLPMSVKPMLRIAHSA